MFGLSELALILIVVAVVVGVKRLPELTRSAGKAARILKSETKALKEEGKEAGQADGATDGATHGKTHGKTDAKTDGTTDGQDSGRTSDAAGPGERRVVTGIIVDRDDAPARDSRDRP
ncbi:twin-arginine translocase TatA/TatE family subunit [Streptomyces sp. NPDC088147]|uniref:twin-arginine translocase TatA/TatE family subunit n=1 Tax=Streptomyces sp. NPDC088147 TaxID=3365830 RepID=UPI00382E0C28